MATRFNDTSILYTTTIDPDTFNYFATSLYIYDVQHGLPYFQYSNRREVIAPCVISYGRSCCIFGHYCQSDNTADLIMHDTRISGGGVVGILDSSREEFGNTTWSPQYDIMAEGSNPWEIVTFWTSPAGKIGHMIKLDIRLPLRREILLRGIEHPRFVHSSKK